MRALKRREDLVRRGLQAVEAVALPEVAADGVAHAVVVLREPALLEQSRVAHLVELLERDLPRRPRRWQRRYGARPQRHPAERVERDGSQEEADREREEDGLERLPLLALHARRRVGL